MGGGGGRSKGKKNVLESNSTVESTFGSDIQPERSNSRLVSRVSSLDCGSGTLVSRQSAIGSRHSGGSPKAIHIRVPRSTASFVRFLALFAAARQLHRIASHRTAHAFHVRCACACASAFSEKLPSSTRPVPLLGRVNGSLSSSSVRPLSLQSSLCSPIILTSRFDPDQCCQPKIRHGTCTSMKSSRSLSIDLVVFVVFQTCHLGYVKAKLWHSFQSRTRVRFFSSTLPSTLPSEASKIDFRLFVFLARIVRSSIPLRKLLSRRSKTSVGFRSARTRFRSSLNFSLRMKSAAVEIETNFRIKSNNSLRR